MIVLRCILLWFFFVFVKKERACYRWLVIGIYVCCDVCVTDDVALVASRQWVRKRRRLRSTYLIITLFYIGYLNKAYYKNPSQVRQRHSAILISSIIIIMIATDGKSVWLIKFFSVRFILIFLIECFDYCKLRFCINQIPNSDFI